MSVRPVIPGVSSLTQEYRPPKNINCKNYLCSLSPNKLIGRIMFTVFSSGFLGFIGAAISYKTYDENFVLGAGIGGTVGFVGTASVIYLLDACDRRIYQLIRADLQTPISPEENL